MNTNKYLRTIIYGWKIHTHDNGSTHVVHCITFHVHTSIIHLDSNTSTEDTCVPFYFNWDERTTWNYIIQTSTKHKHILSHQFFILSNLLVQTQYERRWYTIFIVSCIWAFECLFACAMQCAVIVYRLWLWLWLWVCMCEWL